MTMALSSRARRQLLTWLAFVLVGAVAGELYTHAMVKPGKPELATWLLGARAGALIAGATSALEIVFVQGKHGAAFRRLPFLQFLGLRVAAHTCLVLLMLALNAWISRLLGESVADHLLEPVQTLRNVLFSFAMFSIAMFVAQMRSLVGGRALANVVFGRYYRPQHEERLFLLLDLKGSTPLAVRLGDEQFHELLSALFFDIDAPITEHGGEIYEYVGDAVIASWRIGAGAGNEDRRAVEAVFAAREAVRQRSAWYRQKFGVVPDLRAVLHRGSVVAGECGDSKRQIVFRGETLNTVARLEGLAKALDKDVVASCSGGGLRLPVGVQSHDLGEHRLKGLPAPLHVVALSTAA